ncbi:MAG: SET domain-containing protein [Patescibacteria group bacterium]
MILLPDEYWEIRNTKNKGRGAFAMKDIPKGTVIGDYIGKILRPEDAIVDEEQIYLMYYHDHAVISPDLQKTGVHLLNHSCIPNCWLYTHKGHTLAFALRKILKGEELTIPYLLPPIDKFCDPCPHVCHCGNLNCSKTMHLSKERYKKWRKLNEKWANKTNRERVSFGKDLSLLSAYPKKVQESYIKEIKSYFKRDV